MSDKLVPDVVVQLFERDIPPDLHGHLVIVGSLAAAYHFRDELAGGGVTTKDADMLVTPVVLPTACAVRDRP